MSRDALSSLIASQAAGEIDSVGSFTLNSASALEKSARHQSAELGLWAVKVAQAGVALKATAINFQLSYSSTAIRFHGASPIDGAELARILLSGELPREPWARHLVVGLRSFLGQKPRRLSWTDSLGQTITIENGQVSEAKADSTQTDVSLTILAELTPIPSNFGRLNYAFQQTMAEHAALAARCRLCHIPIRVDGRLISQQFPPEPVRKGKHGPFTHTTLLLREHANGLPVVLKSAASVVTTGRPLAQREEPYVLEGLAVLRQSNSLSSCFWVKDGALLDPQEFDFPFHSETGLRCALDLYFGGAELETDLSEFAVQPKLSKGGWHKSLATAAAKIGFAKRAVANRPLGWSLDNIARADQKALKAAVDHIKFSRLSD